MKTSNELKQERASKIEAQEKITQEVKGDSLSEEQRSAFMALEGEITQLDKDIKVAEISERNAALKAKNKGDVIEKGEERELKKMKEMYDFHKAIRSQLPNGVLDGVEKEIHDETKQRAAKAGIVITGLAVPTDLRSEKRADGQTVTQDSGGYGGNLVAEELQSPIEFLRPKPILETLGAKFMTGLTGNLKFPTNDGGITGAWEGEVDQSGNSKTAYGSKEMKPKRYAASTLISLQNLYQSSFDLQNMTIDDLRKVVANAIDAAGINGPGTGDVPEGILNATGVGSVAAGANGGVPTWAHIIDLETSIYNENAEASSMAYLINPRTKGKLKQTKHESGDLGYLMSMGNEINGYKTGVSNHVPFNLSKGTGTDLSAGIFGDFSQLLIGQWAFLDLTVDNISKKEEGYIKLIVNTFVDVLVRQPKAFSVIKDWVTV